MNHSFKIKLSILLIVSIILQSNLIYAKKKSIEPEFPDAPIAEEKNSKSEGIIYSPMKGLVAISPNHPTPSDINYEEKKLYDNYNISIDTLSKRIEYFSPTYTYALTMAKSQVYGSLMSSGISIDDITDVSNTIKEYVSNRSEASRGKAQYEKIRAEKIAGGMSPTDPTIQDIDNKISALNTTINQLNAGIGQKKYLPSMYYALYRVNDAARIAGLSSVNDQLTKAMTEAILGYCQLNYYVKVLEKLIALDERKIKLYEKSIDLGSATKLDLLDAKKIYSSDLSNYNAIKDQKDSVKRTILLNLGYDQINDFDKVNIIEPSINIESLAFISPINDYAHAYNSNNAYLDAQKDNQSRRNNFDETIKTIRDNYKNQYRDKIIANLDLKYAYLASAYKNYEASKLDKEAHSLDIEAAKRKKELNLVSDLEAIGLDIQNIQLDMQINQANYDLIKAYYDYHFATFGILDVY